MKLHVQTLFVAIGLGIKRNWHIFIAIIAGILFGNFIHENPTVFSPLVKLLNIVGQAFIRVIQMVVIPLVCSAIVVGISSIGDSKQIGKFGKKMILYYGIITVLAVIIGAILVLLFKPGVGVQEFISQTSAFEIQNQVNSVIAEQKGQIGNLFLNMIPQNPLESLAKGEMIPIIFFALIFSLALSKVGEINRPIVSFFESVFAATMKITDWIMIFAAPGIFALTTVAVSSFGLSIFSTISKFFAVVFLGFCIQFFIVYPLILRLFSKVPVSTFFTAVIEALLVAFGTASSSATLPLTIACCEKRGISHKICSFVLPLGATLNMDGTALFQVVAVIFLTQAYGVTLEPIQIIQIMILAIIASSTCAGIPGAGLITIALVLNGLGLTPQQLVEGFAFLFAIDRVVDMIRTTVNVASDAVVAAVIADNENEIDYDLLNNTEQYKEII
ncbi:TPA: dicarboxylate/amino acid:cation symporter [Candidatus Avigastranaerophilus faecigallinarum]|nr:dicarboxylate/amino acid:cation symporter [Candidatus Avigastranaerophilus faecigallinarum]